jgi:Flp pilus assembly protein TadD
LVSNLEGCCAKTAAAAASAILSRQLDSHVDKASVLDMAYEEYCQRLEAGAAFDPEAFCARFPGYQSSLRRLIVTHHCLEGVKQPTAEELPRRWPEPGDTFLGFALLGELGRGAFARVFLATEAALGDRPVAVKISMQGAGEAETLGRLRHPNIVPVFSVQKEELTGLTVICMPYLGGATLCDVLDRAFARPEPPEHASLILQAAQDCQHSWASLIDAPPPATVLQEGSYVEGLCYLAAQLLDALDFIHRLRVRHGDLKPSNVLVTPDGRALLLDFNLSADERRIEQRLGGTLAYMAPEQLRLVAQGSELSVAAVDARADLFSFGVILYELLTGAHPFGPLTLNASASEQCRQLLGRQRRGPKSLREVRPQVSPNLARVIEQCLALDPADRPAFAAELARAIRPGRFGRRWAARWASHHVAAILSACLLLLAMLVASYVLPARPSALERGRTALGSGRYEQAVRLLTEVLEAEPANAKARFTRGCAYQRLGRVDLALADYDAADKQTTDGRIKACLGYCLNRINRHGAASGYYEQAIQTGFGSPEVFNNLGYSYLNLDDLPKAKAALDLAVLRDSSLQAAFYNRALAEIGLALKRPNPAKKQIAEAVKDVRTAIRLGENGNVTSDLYLDAAHICAIAAEQDDEHRDPALRYLEIAIGLGQDPQALLDDANLLALRKDPRFLALVKQPAPPMSSRRNLRLLDLSERVRE